MPRRNMADMQANLAYIRSQTEHVESEVYRTRYPELQYPLLVPVDNTAPEFATAVTYVSTDETGQADWISGGAQDIPLVGMGRTETKTAIHSAAIGYDYTWEEVGQARMLNIPLTSDKAASARRLSERMIDNLALRGDSTKGFEGLLNNSSVTAVNAALNAGASSRLWANKTPLEILKDVNDALTGIWTSSLTIEMANTILLPVDRYSYIATTPMSVDNSMTILEMIMKSNIYTQQTGQQLTVRAVRGLETLGASSTARMVAYHRVPDVVKLHMPMSHRFLPVVDRILNYIVPGVMRTGGTDIRRPGAVRYVDGI